MTRPAALLLGLGSSLLLFLLTAAVLAPLAGPALRLATAGSLDTAQPLAGARPGSPGIAASVLALAGVGFEAADGAARYTPGLGLVLLALAGWWAARIALQLAAPGAAALVAGLVLPTWALLAVGASSTPLGGGGLAALPGTLAALAGVLVARGDGRRLAEPLRLALALCGAAAALWLLAGAPLASALLYAPNVAAEWLALALTTPLSGSSALPLRHAGGLSLWSAPHVLPWWQAEALLASAVALDLTLAAAVAWRAASPLQAAGRAVAAVIGLAGAQALLGFEWGGRARAARARARRSSTGCSCCPCWPLPCGWRPGARARLPSPPDGLPHDAFPPPAAQRGDAPAWCARRGSRPRISCSPCSSCPASDVREPIAALDGVHHLSIEHAVAEARAAAAQGVGAVLLFGLPVAQGRAGSEAYDDEGIVQLATRALKPELPDLPVITDVCLCEYTDHGALRRARADGERRQRRRRSSCWRARRVSHAAAGADIVAPSDMMDGRVGAIRAALDDDGLERTSRSCPTRPSSPRPSTGRSARRPQSAPQFGDRARLPDGPGERPRGAARVAADVDEGADMRDGQAGRCLPRRHRRGCATASLCRSPPTR